MKFFGSITTDVPLPIRTIFIKLRRGWKLSKFVHITHPPIICECNPRALNHRHSSNILRNLEDANTTLVISIGIILLQGGQGSKMWPFREKNCIKIRFCGHIVFCAARELVQVAKTSGLIKTKCVLAHLTFPWQFPFDLAVVCDGDHIKDVQK